jgi:hypothetical protein
MTAVDYVKNLSEFVKKFNDIELNRRILELEDEVLKLSRDKRNGEERIDELETALKFDKKLELKDGFYWAEGDNVGFCTACWDSSRKAIHVKRLPYPDKGHRYECPHCKTLFANPR